MLTYILTSKYMVATLSPKDKMGQVRNESQEGWSLYLLPNLNQCPHSFKIFPVNWLVG